MDVQELFLDSLAKADGDLRRAVDGLSRDELTAQPAGPKSNPIGWLLWHLTRAQDNLGSRATGKATVWASQKWYERLGMEETPANFTPDTVNTFDPKGLDIIMGFYDSVYASTQEWAKALKPADFGRETQAANPSQPSRTVRELLAIIVNDNVQHIGQIAFLRGMLREQGWY